MVIERRTEAGDDIRRGGGGGTIGEADSNLIADGWWCVRACVREMRDHSSPSTPQNRFRFFYFSRFVQLRLQWLMWASFFFPCIPSARFVRLISKDSWRSGGP